METDSIRNLGLSSIALLVVGALAVSPAKSANPPPIPQEYELACTKGDREMEGLVIETYEKGYMLSCYEGVPSIRPLITLQELFGESDGIPSAYKR